jgi:hypothetical protein
MPSKEEEERIRKESQQAKDYFSKIPGFQPSQSDRPAPPPPPAEEESVPKASARPEPPLSEAEKYFKRLLGS